MKPRLPGLQSAPAPLVFACGTRFEVAEDGVLVSGEVHHLSWSELGELRAWAERALD